MIQDLGWALVMPNRRLPVSLYLFLTLLLGFMIMVLHTSLNTLGDSAGGAWQALYLVLLWMNFCVVANRLHDGGTTVIWVVPVYLMTAVIFMYQLDPGIVGPDEDVQEMWGERLSILRKVAGLGGCAIFALTIKLQSEAGRNIYGMPFGEQDWAVNKANQAAVPAFHGDAGRIRYNVPRTAATPTPSSVQPAEPSLVRRRRPGEFGNRSV